MHFIKRAGLSFIHNLKNNIILILLFTVIATLILSGLCIQSASSQQCLAIRKELGSEVVVHPAATKEGIAGTLPLDDLNKVAKLKHVEETNYMMPADVQTVDFKEAATYKKTSGIGANLVTVYGLTETGRFNDFTTGNYTLTSGRHLSTSDLDKTSVIIDESLAEYNNLKTGDSITVKASNGNIKKFTIVGIYKNNDEQKELSALFIPYKQMMTLIGKSEFNYGIFFIDDPLNIDTFRSDVDKLNLSSIKSAQVDAQDATYRRLAGSVSNMSLISTIMVIGIIIAGAVILSLILILNLKGRKFEIGVLLSLGERKLRIVLQMALEVLVPVLIAFSLSIATGNIAAQQIGNMMLGTNQPQSSASDSEAVQSFTGKTYNKIDNVTVDVTSQEILQMYIAGILLALVSTAVPLVVVMRYNPKDIFAKIE